MRQLPRLPPSVPIVNEDRTASSLMVRYWQDTMALLETVPAIAATLTAAVEDAQDAADAADAAAATAQTAADNANAAADSVTSESSLVNSYVSNFTPPVIQADNAGNVTIANHDRVYGDSALNPTVPVTGDTIATGGATPDVVRFYYSDPARAGGAVTFLFTVDPADPPVQGGDTHVVGAVEIPAAGTSDGGYVRPPGYTGPTP